MKTVARIGIALLSAVLPAAQGLAESSACAPYAAAITAARQGGDGQRFVHPERLPTSLLAQYVGAASPSEREDFVGDVALLAVSIRSYKTLLGPIGKLVRRKFGTEPAGLTGGALDRAAVACGEELFGRKFEPLFPEYDDPSALVWEAPSWQTLEIRSLAKVPYCAKETMIADLERGDLQIEGREKPIHPTLLLKSFVQVIQKIERETGIKPHVGSPHRWSQEFEKRYRSKYFPYARLSKLLVTLGRGDAAKYMRTGLEDALGRELLARPRRSVALHELFEMSYRLSGGDVYLTLITIENLLSQNWRDKRRDELAVFTRLAPIIHRFGRNGDQFGGWYHLFGIMLFGYVKGSLVSTWVGNVESWGSHILSKGEPEKQEDYINAMGGKIGSRLHDAIEKYDELPRLEFESPIGSSRYLTGEERYTEALTKLGKKLAKKTRCDR